MGSGRKGKLKVILFAAIPALIIGGMAIGFFVVYQKLTDPIERGKSLNRMAWEASFKERGMPVPPSGPREGYWGSRLNKRIPHNLLGWRETAIHLPGLVEIDPKGFQHFTCDSEDKYRLMILGGSAAFGCYASSIDKTYFNVLGRSLLDHYGIPSEIHVMTGAAWKSIQELRALRLFGETLKPDLVVFLNGLNDLTNGATSKTLFGARVKPADGSKWTLLYHTHDYEQRVSDYLTNMRLAAEYAGKLGSDLLIVLQPSLVERKNRSKIEELILKGSLKPHSSPIALTESFNSMRLGLRGLARTHGVHFLDCSRVFDSETATVFADMWHFSDVGHRILGGIMARRIKTILQQRNKQTGSSDHEAKVQAIKNPKVFAKIAYN